MNSPSSILAGLRSLRLATAPLALLLLTVQTFHGELLQAGQILTTEWTLEALPALPDTATRSGAGVVQADGTIGFRQATPVNHSEVSPTRQAEVLEEAQRDMFAFRPEAGSPGTLRATNPAQNLDFTHDAGGMLITPRLVAPNPGLPAPAPDWSLRYRALALHLDDSVLPLNAVAPSCLDNQSSAGRLPGCTEWFINRGSGLEHGFTIQQPAEGTPRSSLAVTIAVDTDLAATHDPLAGAVEFRNADGRVVASYHTLRIFDHTGRDLPSTMSLATVDGTPVIRLEGEVAGATFPITIDPVTVAQQGTQRMPNDVEEGDGFGNASAGHGDHAAISASTKGNGVVYLYHRNEGGTDNFGQVGMVEVPDRESPGTNDQFGSAVTFAYDEDTDTLYLVVGAQQHGGCGSVFIFVLTLLGWEFLQRLQPSQLTLGARFGCSLSAYGTMIAVGALAHLGKGGVFLFTLVATLFTFFQLVTASNGVVGDEFGFAVALYATLLVVGAPGQASFLGGLADGGGAYAFLAPALGALFGLGFAFFYNNEPSPGDRMGTSVVAGLNRMAIAAPGAAKVVIWTLVLGSWVFLQPILGPAGSFFGRSMTMNHFGDIAVGASTAETVTGTVAGLIYLFLFNAITNSYPFSGQAIRPTGIIHPGMLFGASLFFIGRLLFGMAPNYNLGRGAFYLFLLTAPLLTFSAWLLLYFSQADINDPTKQHLYGFNGNRDGDRFPNFLEYLLGLNPTIADTGFLAATIVNGIYRMLIPMSLVTLGALMIIQYSFNMGTWLALGTGLLATLLTTRILHYGIDRQVLLLTMSIALARAIDPRFFLQVRGETS